jgi:hypothetical protein
VAAAPAAADPRRHSSKSGRSARTARPADAEEPQRRRKKLQRSQSERLLLAQQAALASEVRDADGERRPDRHNGHAPDSPGSAPQSAMLSPAASPGATLDALGHRISIDTELLLDAGATAATVAAAVAYPNSSMLEAAPLPSPDVSLTSEQHEWVAMLEEVERELLRLMKADTLQRFLRSALYRDYLAQKEPPRLMGETTRGAVPAGGVAAGLMLSMLNTQTSIYGEESLPDKRATGIGGGGGTSVGVTRASNSMMFGQPQSHSTLQEQHALELAAVRSHTPVGFGALKDQHGNATLSAPAANAAFGPVASSATAPYAPTPADGGTAHSSMMMTSELTLNDAASPTDLQRRSINPAGAAALLASPTVSQTRLMPLNTNALSPLPQLRVTPQTPIGASASSAQLALGVDQHPTLPLLARPASGAKMTASVAPWNPAALPSPISARGASGATSGPLSARGALMQHSPSSAPPLGPPQAHAAPPAQTPRALFHQTSTADTVTASGGGAAPPTPSSQMYSTHGESQLPPAMPAAAPLKLAVPSAAPPVTESVSHPQHTVTPQSPAAAAPAVPLAT